MADDSGLTSTKEIVEESKRRVAEHAGRIAVYDRYLGAYFGNQSVAMTTSLANYSDGRPALRAPGEGGEGKTKRAAPNYIKPIVKDLVAIRGVWPSVTVPPASSEQGDRDHAVLITRALRQQHDHSNMVLRQQRAGFFLTCLGDCCYTLDPRTPQMQKDDNDPFRPAGVYFEVVNPREAFPRFMGDELRDLFICRRITKFEARDQFPQVRLTSTEDMVDVIHYYSRSERQTVVDGKRAYGIKHDLGFCPAEWVSAMETDGHWAQSDIAGCVDLHDELQDVYKVHIDSIIAAVYPIYHIHDAHMTSGQIELGPGAQFQSTGSGNLSLLQPEANPAASQLAFEMAVDNLMKQTGVSPIRLEGQIDRSNVSARSVDRQQAPMEQRLKLSLALVGQRLQRLNSKALLMLSTVPELKKAEMQLYGQDRNGVYRETFTGDDIGGWVRNLVKWDSMTGTTQEQQVLQRTQLYKEGQQPDGSRLFPFEELVSALYDDPKEIMDRGLAESREHMPPPQPSTPGGPPGPPGGPAPGGGSPDQAGTDQMSLAMGGAGGPPGGGAPGGPVQPPPGGPTVANGNGAAPQIPGFPPIASSPDRRGLGTPGQVPDIAGEVQSALASITLRGTYDLVVRNGHIIVEVSEYKDVPAVKAALQQAGVDIPVKPAKPAATPQGG